MDWKTLPQWVKTLRIISVVLVVLFLCTSIFIFLTAKDLGILTGVVLLVYIGIIIGMWILVFLNKYLIEKNLKWVANIISIVIPVIIVGYFTWAFIWQITNYPELVGSFSQNSFFLIPIIIVIIYFIILVIQINKK